MKLSNKTASEHDLLLNWLSFLICSVVHVNTQLFAEPRFNLLLLNVFQITYLANFSDNFLWRLPNSLLFHKLAEIPLIFVALIFIAFDELPHKLVSCCVFELDGFTCLLFPNGEWICIFVVFEEQFQKIIKIQQFILNRIVGVGKLQSQNDLLNGYFIVWSNSFVNKQLCNEFHRNLNLSFSMLQKLPPFLA